MSTVPAGAPSRRFKIQTATSADEIIVRCSGRLTAEYAEQFKTAVRDLIPGKKCVVLDFTHVEHMDSSGLGAVVRLYVSAKTADCELRLVNFNQRVRELLGLTNLLGIFEGCGKYMIKMP